MKISILARKILTGQAVIPPVGSHMHSGLFNSSGPVRFWGKRERYQPRTKRHAHKDYKIRTVWRDKLGLGHFVQWAAMAGPCLHEYEPMETRTEFEILLSGNYIKKSDIKP